MPRIYRLAILADNASSKIINNVVLRYTTITAYSLRAAQQIAQQIGAIVCGWEVA